MRAGSKQQGCWSNQTFNGFDKCGRLSGTSIKLVIEILKNMMIFVMFPPCFSRIFFQLVGIPAPASWLHPSDLSTWAGKSPGFLTAPTIGRPPGTAPEICFPRMGWRMLKDNPDLNNDVEPGRCTGIKRFNSFIKPVTPLGFPLIF